MKARILVMNHSPEILAILHDLLEDEGYEVKTAEDWNIFPPLNRRIQTSSSSMDYSGSPRQAGCC